MLVSLSDENATLNSLQSLGESSGYESLKFKFDDSQIIEQSNNSNIIPVWQISQFSDDNNECEPDIFEARPYENSSVGRNTYS